jgi:hypothetical protein
MPEDVTVLGVHAEWITNSIQIVVRGDRFPATPDGTEPPRLQTSQEVVKVEVDDEQGNAHVIWNLKIDYDLPSGMPDWAQGDDR